MITTEGLMASIIVQKQAGVGQPDMQEAVIGGMVAGAIGGGSGLSITGLIATDLVQKTRTGRSAFLGGGSSQAQPAALAPIVIPVSDDKEPKPEPVPMPEELSKAGVEAAHAIADLARTAAKEGPEAARSIAASLSRIAESLAQQARQQQEAMSRIVADWPSRAGGGQPPRTEPAADPARSGPVKSGKPPG